MDFFTHLLLGYLISSWFGGTFVLSNTFVMFGSLMAVLPDMDIFFYPLWRKYPMLGHHGVSHTLAFAFLSSTTIYAVGTFFIGFLDFKLLILMYITSTTHILMDSLTTWGVEIFYPFSKRHYKANIDPAVNPFLIIFFFIAVPIILSGYLGYVPFGNILNASYFLAIIYTGYFVTKALVKLRISLRPENEGFTAISTFLPHRWKLARKSESRDEIRVVVKEDHTDRIYFIPKKRVRKLKNPMDIVPYTYWHPKIQLYLNIFDFPYYKIKQRKDNIEISWHTVEMPRDMGIVVRFENGSLKIKPWF